MTTFDLTPTVGLEAIGREVLLILIDQVNSELAVEEAKWTPLDAAFAAATGFAPGESNLEEITPDNFHLGHIPSLIEAPVDQYPNVAVLAYDAKPVSGGGMDQDILEFNCSFYVEIMVKSLTSQEEVNRRIQRTTEAANRVVLANPTLNGLATDTDFRSLTISDVFIREEEKARGPRWYWQGARLDYSVKKIAPY